MKTIDLHGITHLESVWGGTDEWYWSTDDIHGDLYEAEELFRMGHPVQSNRLYLIHYPDGRVYEPVPAVAGQYLGYPVYDNGAVALLVVNFPEGILRILRFRPGATSEVAQLSLSAVKDCYNLRLRTSPLTLTCSPGDNTFEIVWPEQVRFAIVERETMNFRDGGKLYFTAWHEDPDYREETIVRALRDGTILDRFPGAIRIMPNGEKWLVT